MKSIEELSAEHEGIKSALEILEKMCARLERGEKVPTAHLQDMAAFIKEFADRCHHAKEETVLFPEMEKAGVPREGGPIGAMLSEHEAGRSYVKGLVSGITAYEAGAKGAAGTILENARGYIELLREHISKEDSVLYPMAEKCLSTETDAAMLARFEKIEIEEIGGGRHEEFHAMLEKMENEYLNRK
ncbi:MAG: hemerythrin domain-containing protein [Elusimicrobiales bacterium]|nr:hemerythrin domain-containing protein [Elusimicrobiales bacterium]